MVSDALTAPVTPTGFGTVFGFELVQAEHPNKKDKIRK